MGRRGPRYSAHPYNGTVYHPLAPNTVQAASVVMRVAPGTPALRNRLAEMAAATTPPLRVSEVRMLDELYSARVLDDYVGGGVETSRGGRRPGAGFRYKKLRDRESCSLSLNDCSWSVLSVEPDS